MILRTTTLFIFIILFKVDAQADMIYIVNGTGYNRAGADLISAIEDNGHTVEADNILPSDFTTTCVDPLNGYDWLCFFGDTDYTGYLTEIREFINEGGKVFYQYEVDCCETSSASVADIISDLTGLTITPHPEPSIAFSMRNGPGWEATNLSCCATIRGAAFKALDGLPEKNQLRATGVLNGGTPDISMVQNFGFAFINSEFIGSAHKGGIVGMGDVNTWYDGGEPGSDINEHVVDYFFPNNSSTCYLMPPGCNQTALPVSELDLGNDTILCSGETLILDAGTPDAVWQDNSTGRTFSVTGPGTYWVEIPNGACIGSDTIEVSYSSTDVDLGNDTTLCEGQILQLNAGNEFKGYYWNGGPREDKSILKVNSKGKFWVKVEDKEGCTDNDTIEVLEVYPKPVADSVFDSDYIKHCFDKGPLTIGPEWGSSWIWHATGETSKKINVSREGTYIVEVTNPDGCSVSGQVKVENNCMSGIHVPDAFSPNYDGLHDDLEVFGHGIHEFEIKIFNRWGEVIFISTKMNNRWDGTYRGEEMPVGTYPWVIHYKGGENEAIQTKRGSVTLVR